MTAYPECLRLQTWATDSRATIWSTSTKTPPLRTSSSTSSLRWLSSRQLPTVISLTTIRTTSTKRLNLLNCSARDSKSDASSKLAASATVKARETCKWTSTSAIRPQYLRRANLRRSFQKTSSAASPANFWFPKISSRPWTVVSPVKSSVI